MRLLIFLDLSRYELDGKYKINFQIATYDCMRNYIF